MSLLSPTPVSYDPLAWVSKPFAERARMVCEAWNVRAMRQRPPWAAA